ncbi:hypothetical protein F2Q69_00041397 [Brassica cretica]|uniref:Uncharacterized protein n=1 Tax=Brassica cretica TaxID=69181 RepID=A0A8S9NF27_BRACR|nr:hypothetical protein F2Q69_00041397 [Brassica cretica]
MVADTLVHGGRRTSRSHRILTPSAPITTTGANVSIRPAVIINWHKDVVLTMHFVEIAGHRDVCVSGALYGDCGTYGRLC